MSHLNSVDKAVAIFSPQSGLKRAESRAKLQMLSAMEADDSNRGHRSSSRFGRVLGSWLPWLPSPRQEMSTTDRSVSTGRARHAFNNQPVARGAVTRNVTSVVGSGLRLQSSPDYEALGITEEEGSKLAKTFEREFRIWAENASECDIERQHDFYQKTELAFLSSLVNGDVFCLTPFKERLGCIYGLKMRLIEADRVCNENDHLDTPTLVGGVQTDSDGAPLYVHIVQGHKSDFDNPKSRQWKKVRVFGANTGRRRVLQIWKAERPGQLRGISFLDSVIEPLKQLDRWSEAELMAAVINGMSALSIESDFDPEHWPTDEDGNPIEPEIEPNIEFGSGAVFRNMPGEKVNLLTANRPSPSFEPFFKAMCVRIGAALETPAEEILLSYNSSYSAARASMLQAWRHYFKTRKRVAAQFCQPLAELVFDEAVARGRIPVKGYDDPARRAAYTRSMWIGPSRGAIQELQETKAAVLRIEAGLSTLNKESVEMTGEDFDSIHPQRKRERAARKAADLEPQILGNNQEQPNREQENA